MSCKNVFLIIVLGISILVSGCGVMQVSEKDYRKDAIIVDKDSDFLSHPDNFKGKHLILTLCAQEVIQKDKEVELLCKAPNGHGVIDVHYKMKDGEALIEKGEVVRVLGEFQKIDSRKISEMTPQTSVMEIDAKFVNRPMWNRLSRFGSMRMEGVTDSSSQLQFYNVKVTNDGLDITGTIRKGAEYNVGFKGSIKDDGTGNYECFDEKDKPLGVSGTIKMPDSKTVEIDTPEVKYKFNTKEEFLPPPVFIEKTMPAGHYVYKLN